MNQWIRTVRHALPAGAVTATAVLVFRPTQGFAYTTGYVVGTWIMVVGAATALGLLVALYVRPERRRTAPFTAFVRTLWSLTVICALALAVPKPTSNDVERGQPASRERPGQVSGGDAQRSTAEPTITPEQVNSATEQLRIKARRNLQAMDTFERRHPDWMDIVTSNSYGQWRASLPREDPCKSIAGPFHFDEEELARVGACLNEFSTTRARRP